ncbi:glycosyltransferase [Chitinophaga sp. LS1]|uniref:glycosyltransferase n=1 Tax=Chitinophaga sp. LS1 TaxID=3051176 RepID=UPI002AAB8897|nr:glycosyltransferase [Chitinophaga sp. LS1]WPV67803.1 glycosyltransferase [Chitinophaga sp. LS1]
MENMTIVIPCYNEEKRLPINDYKSFLLNYKGQMVFVNDGSSDKTLKVLAYIKRDFPEKVSILHLKKNVGKAEAIRRGILEKTTNNTNNIIGFMDADLSTPFDEVDYFIEALQKSNFKMIFGSRIARIGANIHRFHSRHYFGRIVATAISIYLGIPIYDSQCGAKFFRADFAHQVFSEAFISRWLFDVEIFKRILQSKTKVDEICYELPLHTWIEKGDSKLTIHDVIKLPFEFYRIANYYMDKENKTDVYGLYQDYRKPGNLMHKNIAQ